ncbi:MAG: exodeoxyribonuclease V subunit gamma, partial [Gemmatimonadales bacterium]
SLNPAPGITESELWQRALWRSLVEGTASRSPAQIVSDIRAGRFQCPDSVAPVVLAVADPTMPPTILEALQAISNERDVRWCVVAFGGTSPNAIASSRFRSATRALEGLGLAPMLARKADTTLLGRVQLFLDGDSSATDTPSDLDDSLTLHACHSPLREIETLRERLIVDMEADPELRPHDVTLYVTSLDTYLPAIDAVFGLEEPGLPRLPYEVAGRPFRDRSPVIFAFLRLLEACEGRATLEEISSLLRLAPITGAAGFSELETDTAISLAVQSGVVWGIDGEDRHARFDLPPIASGTWRHGVDRLVLGVAMGRTDRPVGEVLPVSGDSAGNAELIGRLAGWTDQLFALFAELRRPRAAEEWSGILEDAIRVFVKARTSEDYEAFRTLRLAIEELLTGIAKVSNRAPITVTAIRTLLEQTFEDMAGELGHLRGGMRVCRLEPGTIIPSRIVLIAGVDDALHPGGGGNPAWDLLTASPQDGDPDRRADSLDAFRQAVSSARSRVHVAWTGFTTLRHDIRAASIAVSELRDIVGRVLTDDAQKQLVRDEPAHPFSASHFEVPSAPGHIQSAASGWAATARLIPTRGADHHEFARESLDRSVDEPRVVSIDTLSSCFKDPSLFFCRSILGLQMYDNDDELPDCEPQAINPPGEKGVHNDFRTVSWKLEAAQRRGDTRSREQISEWLRHQPEMPYGEEGRVLADAVAEAWWLRLEELRSIAWQPPRTVDLQVGEWRITGRLDHLSPDARVIECLYEIKPHSAVSNWVPHLVMNVLAQRGATLPRVTSMLGATPWTIGPVDDAEAELIKVCEFYEQARLAPQPLFRRSGCAWLAELGNRPEADVDEATRAKAYRKARDSWDPMNALPGLPSYKKESEQASSLLCWPNRSFDDPAFVALFADCTERMLLPFMSVCSVPEGR